MSIVPPARAEGKSVPLDDVAHPAGRGFFTSILVLPTMAPCEPFDPAVEVRGRTVLAVVDDGLARFSEAYWERARETLADHGVTDPTDDEWCPQAAWLATFEQIAGDLDSHLLDRLGEQIPDAAEWPDDTRDNVPTGLRTIDEAYQRNHRGGEIGSYGVERTGEHEVEIVCETPYPCAFDRGLIREVARRSSPVETFVFVEETGEECRRDGADTCTYTVHW
jgi:hypothetical protein